MTIARLMLNDWVIYNGYPCRIYSLQGAYPREGRFNDKPVIDVWIGNGFLSVGEDEIKPISLTEKILEKNGFKQTSAGYRYKDKYENKTFELVLYEQMAVWYIRVSNNFPIIHYVHELQHALRLCGLDELADNFRIE